MDKIKIVAETIDGLYNASEDDIKDRKRTSNWWYLHGELEDLVGFDKGIIVDAPNLKHKVFIDKDINKQYTLHYLETGIYDVEIVGIDKLCKAYFWTSFEEFSNIDGIVPCMRGLVVFKDDKKANNYAYKKYCERSEIL